MFRRWARNARTPPAGIAPATAIAVVLMHNGHMSFPLLSPIVERHRAKSTAASTKLFDDIYRTESRRVFATLIRLLGDFDLAEEALQDAFTAALEQWPRALGQKPDVRAE